MDCPDCNREMIIKKVPYFFKDLIYLGDFEAEVCEHCDSIYFSEISSRQIELRAKLIGIWGKTAISIEEPLLTVTARRMPKTAASIIFGDRPSPRFKIGQTISV